MTFEDRVQAIAKKGFTERQARFLTTVMLHARIYHVKQRAVYAAIGEPDSTLRRRLTLNRAIQRLMVLVAIVEDPDLAWLGTAEEKAAHLTALTTIAPTDLPNAAVGIGNARKVRYFPERLPIGCSAPCLPGRSA